MLPDNLAYFETVQNPRNCFNDPDLQAGEVVTNSHGLPLACTGNFAIVFRVTTPSGDWAVKCFTRDIPNLQQRYHAVSEHLRQRHCRFLLPFHYHQQGIRVRGTWYPIVKMQWVNGLTLRDFIDRFLERKRYIEAIMYSLYAASVDMRKKHIAHGDLQHGNIIIANYQDKGKTGYVLRLVDYDGLWVPALKKVIPSEYGHRNYQHPGRPKYYGPLADHFSLLAIYTGLCALRWNPQLWREYNNGENILFSEKDYQQPELSSIFQLLWCSPDDKLRRLIGHLVLSLYTYVDQVLPLSRIVRYSQPLSEPEVLSLEPHQVHLIEKIFNRAGKLASGPSRAGASSAPSGASSSASPYHLHTTPAPIHPIQNPSASMPVSSSAASPLNVYPAPPTAASVGSGSPLGSLAAVSSPTAVAYAKVTVRLKRTLLGHRGKVYALTFSPASSLLASTGADGLIRLWDPSSGQMLRPVNTLGFVATSLAFSPDGRCLVSSGSNGTIQGWDTIDWKCSLLFQAHSAWVNHVSFLGQTHWLVSAGEDGLIKIWESRTGQLVATLTGHKGEIWSVASTSDGRHLVSGGSDQTVRVWEIVTQRQVHRLEGHADRVLSIALSPNGRWVISGSWDETVRLWDITSGQQVSAIGRDVGRVHNVTLSRNGQWLIYGGDRSKVAVWDFSSLTPVLLLENLPAPVLGVALSPDHRWLAAAGADGSILLWEWSTS